LAGLLVTGGAAHAQLAPAGAPKEAQMTRVERADRMQTAPLTFFHLQNSSNPNDGNELLTGLRLMLDPAVKMYLLPGQNIIAMRALPDDVALATQFLRETDLPKKDYRVSFTLTEMDGGKRMGVQHVAMVVQRGQRMTLKQGSKVPISTGKFNVTNDVSEQEMAYTDVGLSFDVTLSEVAAGGQLKAKVEQSGIADDKPQAAAANPTIRQTLLEGTALLNSGKPVMLGALDIPGSTRHLDVEVMVEPIP